MSEVFDWSEEQIALRDVVADFCRRHPGAGEGTGPGSAGEQSDHSTWRAMSERLSLAGLTLDPSLGGLGGTALDAGVVAEECARALVATPMVSTVGAVETVLRCFPDERASVDLARRIAEESLVAAAAVTDADGAWDPASPPLSAREAAAGWQVTGASGYVPDGERAAALLCHARTDAGEPLLLLVDPASPGVTVRPVTSLDPARELAHLELSDATGTLVARGAEVTAAVGRALDTTATLLAVEQVGIAAAMLERSVEHARTRLQFGRPIGSFQAVKHRVVDMYVAVEHARSTAYHALWAVSDDGVDAPRVASSLAFTVASRAAREVTRSAVQVHGGVGFTWEHVAHRYLKAAVSNATLAGGTAAHERRLAGLALAPTGTEVTR